MEPSETLTTLSRVWNLAAYFISYANNNYIKCMQQQVCNIF